MPEIVYEFVASGSDHAKAYEGIARPHAWPAVQTAALAAAMRGVGPAPEWAWFDFLSPGDVMRALRLRDVINAADTVDDVRAAAHAAFSEIRRVARERMNPPDDADSGQLSCP